MTEPKLCRECEDAVFFDTGSSLFYLCQKSGEMRGYYDRCGLKEVESESRKVKKLE